MSFLLLLLFIFNFKSYQALSIHKRILTKDTLIKSVSKSLFLDPSVISFSITFNDPLENSLNTFVLRDVEKTIPLTCTNSGSETLTGAAEIQCHNTDQLDTNYNGEYTLSYVGGDDVQFEFGEKIKLAKSITNSFTLKKSTIAVESQSKFQVTIAPEGSTVTYDTIAKVTFKVTKKEDYVVCKSVSYCENLFITTDNKVTIVLDSITDRYSLYTIEDTDGNIKKYEDNDFVVRDYSLLTNFFIVDDGSTSSIEIIIDYGETGLVQDKILINNNELNDCQTVQDTQKKCTYSVDTKPTDLSIKLNTDDTATKIINVIQFSLNNNNCAITGSGDTIMASFTSVSTSEITFKVFYGANDNVGQSLTLSSDNQSESITYNKDTFGSVGSYSLFYKIKDQDEKKEIPNSTIEIINSLNIKAISPLSATTDSQDVKILVDSTITSEDVTTIELKVGNTVVGSCQNPSVVNSVITCSVSLTDVSEQVFSIYYTNKCSKSLNSGKTISVSKKLVTLTETKIGISSIEGDEITISLSYLDSVLLPSNTKVQFVDKSGAEVTDTTQYALDISTKCITVQKSNLKKGIYKLKTIPVEDNASFSFISEDSVLIYHSALTINNETPLSLEQTKESKVIEITFNNEVTLEQINSLSLTSTTITTPVSLTTPSTKPDNSMILLVTIPENQLTKADTYTITIEDKASTSVLFTFTVTSKYSIVSLSRSVFFSSQNSQLVITYNTKFSANPNQIELIPSKGINKIFNELTSGTTNDGNASTITITLTGLTADTYKIQTTFTDENAFYTFVSTDEKKITISDIDTSSFIFKFNRLYFVKKNDGLSLEITVEGDTNGDVKGFNCKDSTGKTVTVKYEKNKGTTTLSEPETYSFEYTLTGDITIPMDEKVIVSTDPLVGFASPLTTCYYNDESLSITINYKNVKETDKQRIIPLIVIPGENGNADTTVSFGSDSSSGETVYTITNQEDKAKIKDKTFNVLLIENNIQNQPLLTQEITFTSITPKEYCLKGFPCKFTTQCDIPGLKDKISLKNDNDNTISFDTCYFKDTIAYCTVSSKIESYGTYYLAINSKENILSTTFVSNSLTDTSFTLTIPSTITEGQLDITIDNSSKNDFYMNLIQKVTITKDNSAIYYSKANTAEAGKFILDNNVIKFSITYAAGETYMINSIQRNLEGDTDTEDAAKYTFTTGNTITDNPFTITMPHQYIDRSTLTTDNSSGSVTFIITPIKSDLLSIDYRFTEGDTAKQCTRTENKETFSCQINEITEAKTVYFTAGEKTTKGYISLYEVSTTTCYDIDTTNSVTILTLTTPSGIDSQPQLQIGGLTTSITETEEGSGIFTYSSQYTTDVIFPLTTVKPTLFYTDNDKLELTNTFSFNIKYSINTYQGLLLEKKASQDLIVSFSDTNFNKDLEKINIYLSKDSSKVIAECSKQSDLNYKCTFDLSTSSNGDYSLGYTSTCGDVSSEKTVKVYTETDLLTFDKESYTTADTITITVTDNTMTYLALYVKESADTNYVAMTKNNLQFTYSPPKAGTYKFAYSILENENKVEISKTVSVSEAPASQYVLFPEIQTCYYNKNALSFTIKNSDNTVVSGKSFTVSLTKSGETTAKYTPDVSDTFEFTIGDATNGVDEGTYSLSIKEGETEVYLKTLSFTAVTVSDFYYKSKITIQAICVLPITLSDSTVLTCTQDTTTIQKCTVADTFASYTTELAVNTGSVQIKEKIIISNDIANSKFTITKPETFKVGQNDFILKSSDFSLDKISQFTVTGFNEPITFTPTDEKNKFVYNQENKQIEFSITLEALSGTYTLDTIQRTFETEEVEADYKKELKEKLYSSTPPEEEKCIEGLIQLEDGTCVLPEEDKTTDDESKCLNYCQNNGTCSIVDSKPICQCLDNYYGVNCALTNANVETESKNYVESIFSSETLEDPNKMEEKLNNDNTIVQLRTLSVLAQQNYVALTNAINDKTKIYSTTRDTVQKAIDNKNLPKGIFDLIVFAFHVEVSFFKVSKLRNLQTSNPTELDYLIQQAKDLNEAESLEEDKDYFMKTDPTKFITYQRYKLDKGLNEYKKSSLENKLPLIELESNDILAEDAKIMQTTFSAEINEALGKSSNPSGIVVLSALSNDNKQITLSTYNTNFKVSLPNTVSIFNEDLFKYYLSKGINIYDPNDKAFTDPCFISKNFDFDLTQKYRRKNLYQGYKITSDVCTYVKYDLTTNLIEFTCDKADSKIDYSLEPSTLNVKVNHVDNLPTKCDDDVENIEENIAFWLFLLGFIVIIIFDILLAVGGLERINNAINNDELQNNQEGFSQIHKQVEHAKTESEDRVIKPEGVQIDIPMQQKTFCSILCNNFKSLHPLFSLCHQSILSPMLFTSWVFLYNLLNLFGFNALYFNETMIEDRIYDKHRDNFGYPMKTEFEKIMAAISTCIALTIIVRLITLVTYGQKEKLMQQIQTNKAIDQVIGEFNKSMLARRIIAGIFMLALNVFFFYYCICFCNIYINAQYGWFYSGIWSLIFNWVAYAPLYIVIISAIESSGSTSCAYYMKRLFVF